MVASDRLHWKKSVYFPKHLLYSCWIGWGYMHDSRADKDPYPHDRSADKDSYPHDRMWLPICVA